MFPGFLWPYTIKRVQVTPGQTNQTFGHWEGETEAAGVDITGMVQTLTLKELEKLDAGIFSAGDRKITVDKTAGVQVGDRIKIYENGAGTEITEWEVREKSDAPNASFASLALDFETFLLSRRTV